MSRLSITHALQRWLPLKSVKNWIIRKEQWMKKVYERRWFENEFRVALFLWAVFEELHGVYSRAQDYYFQYILKAVELLWN